MSYCKMAFNCRVNTSFNKAVKHVINAINHILKTIFQTAECGLKDYPEDLHRLVPFYKR